MENADNQAPMMVVLHDSFQGMETLRNSMQSHKCWILKTP